MRSSLRIAAAKLGRSYPLFFYLAGVLAITAAAVVACWRGVEPTALCLLAIPILMCASQFGITIVNWLATVLVAPRPLPRLDFSTGIPPEHRTMVVVPTMLSSAAVVQDLLEALEVRYLANRDANVHFALC